LSKMAQFAEVSPLSNDFSSLTIRTSQIFVIPSQSAETILSPYKSTNYIIVKITVTICHLLTYH
jgi:hypothetical protein